MKYAVVKNFKRKEKKKERNTQIAKYFEYKLVSFPTKSQ